MEFKFTDPVTDFSNGLQVLKSYHQDFLTQGEQLITLAKRINQQDMNEDLANQCMEMYCYYSHASHLHHKDEEEAFFPLLVEQSSLVLGMMERLIMDHEEIETSWEELAKRLSHPEKITNTEHFLHLATEFEKSLKDHIFREDEDFFPHIEKQLSSAQLQQAGQKMADLRHI